MTNPTIKDLAFVEKYRPQKIDDVVGDFTHIKKYMQNPQSLPHLLFVSKVPGSGKTTLAKAIIREVGSDYLELNASDERGIETVRNKVNSFVRNMSSNNIRKCVMFDEADGMSKDGQDALRNVMETYVKYVYFILTANHENKISDAIKSRCEVINFSKPDKEQIKKFLRDICDKESIIYDDKGMDRLVNINYPSIRDCVKYLQMLKVQEKPLIENNVVSSNDDYKIIWELINKGEFKQIINKVYNDNIDCYATTVSLFDFLMQTDDKIPNKFKIASYLGTIEKNIKFGCIERVQFLNGINAVIDAMKISN